jgi:hypothetical protein
MKKIILVNAVALIISTGLFAQNTATINLTKGQKYIVENKITTKGSSEMQGQSIESNADVTSTYSIEIKDLNGNNYNMVNTISGIKMSMTMMGQDINFDSDKKEDMDGEIGSKLKNFINQPQSVVMNKSGDVIISNDNDSAKNSETALLLKQMGSDPKAEGYGAKMAFFPLPKKIKAGTSWKDSTSSEDGVTRVTNYTVKEVKEKTATISIEGTENRNSKVEVQGMEVTTKTTGKFSGEEMIDITTGIILQNNTTTDSTGSVSIMGQDVPMTAKVTSVTTVKPM